MAYEIKITRNPHSRLSELDFDNIPFGKTFTDHMFIADYDGEKWVDARIVPSGPITMHPGNLTLHYGQSVFEGMKATKSHDGSALFFRPEKHVERLNASAKRMCMAEIDGELFLQGLHALVNLEQDWIPPSEGSALYIRPFMFATDEFIGVKPSKTYRFMILTLPVGPYYPKPVSLLADETYVRAAHGGVGEAKAAGNYAASLYPAKLAMEAGYDQVLWLDAKEFKYIQEVGTMNVFFVIDGKVITPATDGAILKGITRETVIQLLKDKGYTVEERAIHIDEIMDANKKGTLQEIFGTGTAAVVARVDRMKYQDTIINVALKDGSIAQQAKDMINGIRSERMPDEHGWVVRVRDGALV
jgi:branched-chain amino acid aminotransferase